jgi:hypothetical protein
MFFPFFFEAIGLVLFVPIALFLSDRLPRDRFLPVILLIGAAIGAVVSLPISQPNLRDLTLPMLCGAASALVWFVINRRQLGRSL